MLTENGERNLRNQKMLSFERDKAVMKKTSVDEVKTICCLRLAGRKGCAEVVGKLKPVKHEHHEGQRA